ncbi:peptide chain release factor N(5)-glutamine methyltransferase [Pseudoalteromonas sp. SSDWG2]|uniref:peptide chain release factor N(5)-glutamine methyltransferase n=1 Tax=Pseudoalteromonas sp. SSDWG2 TaxID=3139391 RepID=UPI003BA9812D
MPTIEAALKSATVTLSASSESPKLDAEVLLLHVLQKPRSYLFAWGDQPLSEQQDEQFSQLIAKRSKGHPVAHLTGVREFWSLPFFVNDSTLIPRPDTETLVEHALSLSLPENARVLDLGTGTGAIALALASERSKWQIDAVDASASAVELALKNQKNLMLNNVRICQSDWFSALDNVKYELIVTNPPYIDETDPHLSQGDVRYEPLSALVAPNKGLGDIEHIIVHARAYLSTHGVLIFEHGYDQGSAVRELFAKYGYIKAQTVKDLGGNERITLAELAS